MLRLAARAPCRSGPVTSTLGRTSASAPVQAHSKPSLGSHTHWRASVAPGIALVPAVPCSASRPVHQSKGVTIGRYAPASFWCDSYRQQVSCGWRFAPACCAAQSVHGRAACAAPGSLGSHRAGGAMGHRLGTPTAGASSTSALAAPLFRVQLFGCQRRKARPNMSVNRSLHGMPPWPRCALCPCCASRPRHHAVPARLPLR
jgi:hypothetical protein